MRIKNTEIDFNFSFFAVTAFVIVLDKSGVAMLSLAACMLHEAGHILLLMLFSAMPQKITFYGGGIAITDSEKGKMLHGIRRISVLFAGCAVNFALFAICFTASGFIADFAIFGTVNLIIGLFNILPIGYFDGAEILVTALEGALGTDRAHLVKNITGGIVLALFFAAVTVYCMARAGHISLSLCITLLYLLAAQLMAGR